MISLPFANGFYSLPNTSINSSRCVNWCPNIVESPSRSQAQLLGIDGIAPFIDVGDAGRGAIEFQGELYILAGNDFVKVNAGGTVTTIQANAVSGTDKVIMAENGLVIALCDPFGFSYFYDPTPNTFTQITDPDFVDLISNGGRATSVTYSDGFFVWSTDEILFNGSVKTTNKGQDFNALEFTEAEQFTDDIVRVIASQGSVYCFGERSYEIYRINPNTTIGDFAFQRISSQNNEFGLFGRFNIVDANNVLYFIGGGRNSGSSVWSLSGASITRISTDAIDILIDSRTSGFGWAYSLSGHFYRGFTFSDTSIVYDEKTKLWHERQSDRFKTGWSPQVIIDAFGKIAAIDKNGVVGVISSDNFSDFGAPIYDYFTTQPFSNQQEDFALVTLEAVCQSGVGNSQVASPTIAMSYSADGITFSNERYRDLGAAGDRQTRQIWRNQGRFDQDTVLRFSVSSGVRKCVIDLQAEFI